MSENDLFAKAYAELGSPDQKTGLWARCFSESGGDESKAKAAYIAERVKELTTEAVKTGFCPNCNHECLLGAGKCEKCGALFSSGGWELRTHEVEKSRQSNLPAYEGSYSPPPEQKTKFKWWLWVPIGLISAFLAYGFSIPKNVAEANAFFRVCRDEMVIRGLATMEQCQQREAEIRAQPSNSGQSGGRNYIR